MNRISTLALALFLLAAPAAAPAASAAAARQHDAVLAGGDPPLTRAMVGEVGGFFEWLFEARLATAQRDELERILVGVWQRDARDDIKSVLEFGELNSKLAAATAEQRREVRAALLPKVIESLRAEPDDFARLMLGFYAEATAAARGHAGGGGEGAGEDASALLGSWRTSQLSMLVYQNQVTGSTAPASGTSMQYRFGPDGRFEYHGYLQSTMYNCTTTLFNPMGGGYRLAGTRLTLTPSTNLWQMRNNCAPSQNQERPGKMDALTYEVSFKQQDGRLFLCLTGADGKGSCYQKE